jgi:hypothetical protein
MDERVMLAWVDEVLKPYVAIAPEHVIPILILDSYSCHMMASVVTKWELGIEVKSTSQVDAPPSVNQLALASTSLSRIALGGSGCHG